MKRNMSVLTLGKQQYVLQRQQHISQEHNLFNINIDYLLYDGYLNILYIIIKKPIRSPLFCNFKEDFRLKRLTA